MLSSRHGTVRDHAASPTRPRRCRTMRDLGCSVSRDVPNGHHSSVHVSRRSRLEPNGHNVPTVPRRFPDGPGRSSGPQRDQAVFAKIANPCGTFSTKSCVCPSVPHGPAWSHVLPRGASVVPMFPTFFSIFPMVPIGPNWSPSIQNFPTRSPPVPTVPNGVHGPDSVQTVPNSPNGPAKWSRMVPNGHRRSRFSQMVPNALGLFGPVWGRFVIIGTFDCVWDRSGPCGTVGPVEKIGDRMEHVGTALGTVWDRVGPCGTIGTAGDGWGPLGTAGDRWGQLGTVWDGGVTSGRTAVHAVHAVHADRMGVFSVADRVGRS